MLRKLGTMAGVLFVGCSDVPTPTVIAHAQGSVRSVVAASGGVYWAESGLGKARVMRVPADVIADQQLCPDDLATDQTSLFWLRCDGAVASAPTTGGATTLLVPAGGFASNSLKAIAVTSDLLYITVGGTPGEIVAVSKQPGTAVATVVSNLTAPGPIAADDTNLYWLDASDAAVYQRARQADPATPPTRLAALNTDTTFRTIEAIATDGVHLYWSDAEHQHVHAMRISDGARFEISTSGSADAFALDATHVYWISGLSAAVERAPLSGGDTEAVAETQSGGAGYPAATIALTADSVIYVDDPTDCDRTIMDCFPTTIESVPK